MATQHSRTGSGARKRNRGVRIGPLSPASDHPPTASESASFYVTASNGRSPTDSPTGSRLIGGGASDDTSAGTSVWPEPHWFEKDGKNLRFLIIAAAGAGNWRRQLEGLLLDDDADDSSLDEDTGCARVRESLPRPSPPSRLGGLCKP